ncbi:MAG TPA: phosphate/phosphite/phosphonate ABC transporter substrate-binding protein [Chthoniobacterales bacterium]|jgi:phosphonate transport system substrate-binding protein|nr:phosphate/phosphite/phosphonate ABC transporter substrate-binding protein [Chthoniobacterales bacterium]
MNFRHLLTALLFVLSSFALPARADLSIQKVVIALKPDKNPEQMLQERKTLSDFLTKKLGKPVEVIVPLSSSVIIEGFANGTVDLGYLSATDMVAAQKRNAGQILLAGELNGRNFYQSYWLSLKEKPYNKVEDLRGKPVAFASKTSTSGYLIPIWDLKQKGLLKDPRPEAFFGEGNLFYGTGYVSAIERVLNGQAEAAAVSYYVLDLDKHLTVGQRGQLKKVAEQGPVPTHVIAVRSSIPEADRVTLRKALESMNEPENAALRDKVFTSKLVEVNPEEHLRAIREALDFLGDAK